MRSVADHHVDRPGMQARQRVQSTGTNPPIGLIRSGEGGSMSVTELTDRSPHRSPARAPGGVAVQRGKTVSSEAPAATRRLRRHPTLQAPVKPLCAGGLQGLVATARGKHPVPSRTRPLSPAAPMVLRLKTRESRSPPDHMFSLFAS